MSIDFLSSPIRRTHHNGTDDLLSAGLGLAGLTGLPVPFVDPVHPTPEELRRRAIQTSWKGIADLGPLGGYGQLYGGVPDIAGREFSAFAHLPATRHPHRVLCQIPDAFDAAARCLIVAPSSGSRGIYGAIALAGAWGLPHGCALAYTDKGTGSGYYDCADGSGVALDGTRADAANTMLEFAPHAPSPDAGIAVKHAHSGDQPEARWGEHVLQAAHFGLAMLDEAFPAQAPFTPDNTRIIAVGMSNGGGAVLQAAGLDEDGLLDGVVALEPNVHVAGHGRALYDYASEAALLMPCALSDQQFATLPFARAGAIVPPAWLARGTALHARGLLQTSTPTAQAAEALQRLHAGGWQDAAIEAALGMVAFDMWRAIAVTYASAYLQATVDAMPCGFAFHATNALGQRSAATPAARAAWWPDGSGIPPDGGVGLFGATEATLDPTLPGVLALRALWDGDTSEAEALHCAVSQLGVKTPRADLPIWVVHGAEDGLIPAAFTADAYIACLRAQGRAPRYWRVPHAQHFDAFLALPGFGDRYVPLLPYGYAALDQMAAHVIDAAALANPPTPQAEPRGAGSLGPEHLKLK